jgi:hypothetical protein
LIEIAGDSDLTGNSLGSEVGGFSVIINNYAIKLAIPRL